MGNVGAHILAVLVVLTAVFGVGFGIYILAAESVWISAFGLPVRVEGFPKVMLGIFSFAPAVLFGALFIAMRRGGRAKNEGGH